MYSSNIPAEEQLENSSLSSLTNQQVTFETYDDGAFSIILSRFGIYNSKDRNGEGITCGLDKDAVIFWSREHLNGFQNSTYVVSTAKLSQDSLA